MVACAEHPLADVKEGASRPGVHAPGGKPCWRSRNKNIEVRSPRRRERAEERSAAAVVAAATCARKSSPAAEGKEDKHSN